MPRAVSDLFARSPRVAYALTAGVYIAAGLLVYLGGSALPHAARDVMGDALWAAMMASLVSATRPSASRAWRCAVALAICYAVEGSQLWHTPTLDALRATRVGHLVLGSGFDARDLVSYTAGIIVFAWIDSRARRNAAVHSR